MIIENTLDKTIINSLINVMEKYYLKSQENISIYDIKYLVQDLLDDLNQEVPFAGYYSLDEFIRENVLEQIKNMNIVLDQEQVDDIVRLAHNETDFDLINNHINQIISENISYYISNCMSKSKEE